MNPYESLNSVGTQVVVDALRQIDSLKGILCFGSYAVGSFDADSDVDLYVLWHPEVPSCERRRSILRQIKGIEDPDVEHTEPGWPTEEWFPHCDRFRLNNVLFDLGHNTLGWLTSAVRKAMAFPSEPAGREHLNMLGLLGNSVILEDQDECLLGLMSQLYPFPSGLKTALISKHMTILKNSLGELLDYTRRRIGNTAFQFHLMRIANAIGGLLFAINETYDPATKRVEEAFRKLPLTPPSFLKRYAEIMSTSLDEGSRQKTTRNIGLLLEDIERLIEGHAEPAHSADRGR
jgi:predicted nucleotidyltransferase